MHSMFYQCSTDTLKFDAIIFFWPWPHTKVEVFVGVAMWQSRPKAGPKPVAFSTGYSIRCLEETADCLEITNSRSSWIKFHTFGYIHIYSLLPCVVAAASPHHDVMHYTAIFDRDTGDTLAKS